MYQPHEAAANMIKKYGKGPARDWACHYRGMAVMDKQDGFKNAQSRINYWDDVIKAINEKGE